MFEDVSKDFLTEFFRVSAYEVEIIDFVNCSIPRISLLDGLVTDLTLRIVPPSDTDLTRDKSLYNVINSFSRCINLNFSNCATLDDDFIHWLAKDDEDGECGAHGISFLDIKECPNFTLGAIRRLVESVNHPDRTNQGPQYKEDLLLSLSITGPAPKLEDADLEWFREEYKGDTAVDWLARDGAKCQLPQFGHRRGW